ncbi:MAG: hypothetical protein JXA89_11900 [Anaerolineae bacterium]|nr:hypothetical protein [Anaerolineae bacterium]
MEPLIKLCKMIIHPKRTSREILQDTKSIRQATTIVIGFGAVLTLLFLISHLTQDYPPPADELATWIETWGEFPMLPFLKIPAEQYRLAQALFGLPLVLAIWILMAGSARLLSVAFKGQVPYEQYLSLFGFSFFAFWILGQILDITYSAILEDAILRALRMEYGAAIKEIVALFPAVMWTGVLTLGGIYNGIVTYESEGFSAIKAGAIAMATFVWPIVLISVLIR